MKLKRKELQKIVSPYLFDMGYLLFKEPKINNPTDGMYCKKLDNGLFMTLGLIRHRFYDCLFTIDLYLSRTTNFACCWKDIPRDCYTRPGFYLTEEELKTYGHDGKITKDLWWTVEEESIFGFVQTLKMAHSRMTVDEALIKRIWESTEVKKLVEQSQSVIEQMQSDKSICIIIDKEVAKKCISLPPQKWYDASFNVLCNYFPARDVNPYRVHLTAEDAYRQFVLNYIHNK